MSKQNKYLTFKEYKSEHMEIADILAINHIIQNKDFDFINRHNLTINDFGGSSEQCQFIIDHYEKYGETPSPHQFLNKFVNYEWVEVTDSPKAIADNLINAHVTRYTIYVTNMLAKALNTGEEESKNAIKVLGPELTLAEATANTIMYEPNSDLCDDLIKDFDEDTPKHLYNTGLDWLDEHTHGWDKDNEYVVVAGRPGTGKSMMLCKLALEQLRQGRTVAFYEGEMSKRQTLQRLIAGLYGLSATDMLLRNKNIREQYIKAVEEFRNFKFHIITPQDIGRYPTAQLLENFCKKVNADILFIDQQSLMTDEENSKISFEKSANISRQIKTIRDRLNIPVITAVQLNRTKTENGSADTVQLAGSDVIGQDATKVLILTKEENDKVKLTLAKNRNGRAYISTIYNTKFEYCAFLKDNEEVKALVNNEEVGEDVF